MQNVGTPRFYIDWNSYNNAMGVITSQSRFRSTDDGAGLYSSIYNLNPANQRYLSPDLDGVDDKSWGANSVYDNGWILDPEGINWIGLLGHNLGNTGTGFGATFGGDFVGSDYPKAVDYNPIVNGGVPSTSDSKLYPELDGFTIAEIGGFSDVISTSDVRKLHLEFHNDTPSTSMVQKFGAYCLGKYYDMPHSPDLKLKLSYEYDGVKNIQTKGGATLSNASYTKPADWGDRGAWQLGSDEDGKPISNIRSGRRVWDLSFSYLSDTDIMAKVAATTNLEATNGDYEYSENPNENTLLYGTDFFSVVWNRTMGGHLPFIFNPSGGGTSPNNNPDQFAICRFVNNSLQYDQVANNVYNIKLKIRECW